MYQTKIVDEFQCLENLPCKIAEAPPCKIGLFIVINDEFAKLKQILTEQLSHDNEMFSMIKEGFHFDNVVLIAFTSLTQQFQYFNLIQGLIKKVFGILDNFEAHLFVKLQKWGKKVRFYELKTLT